MTPFVTDPDFTLYVGDAREVLRELPDESVDCAATSPPFYGLRDYGTGSWNGGDSDHEHDTVGARGGRGGSGTLDKRDGDAMPSRVPAGVCSCGAIRHDPQIGLEATPEEWVAELVSVFQEVRRTLKPHGTLWIECGDSYVSGQGGRQSAVGELPPSTRFDRKDAGEKREGLPSSFGERDVGPRFYPSRDTGLKPKDLLGQPWLLAFALRADGWWLRQAIIWHKPNAMPESATDRCTTNHSYVFLFSKQPRYFFDSTAISEPAEWARWGDQTVPKYEGTETASGWMQPKSKGELVALGNRKTNGQKPRTDERRGFDNRLERADGFKNPRSVWTVPTQGYSEAHFATWPEALVERIIKAGTSERGVCPECGAPWRREVEPVGDYADALTEDTWASGGLSHGRGGPESARKSRTTTTTTTTGWRPSCRCGDWLPSGEPLSGPPARRSDSSRSVHGFRHHSFGSSEARPTQHRNRVEPRLRGARGPSAVSTFAVG